MSDQGTRLSNESIFRTSTSVLFNTIANPKPILYSYFRSSCSWRVRIALAIKKIDYEYSAVNLNQDRGQQRTDDFTNINPMQQVPTLVINGCALSQSVAILEYLDEVHPEPALFPKDPLQRAQVREIVETICSGIQPLQSRGSVLKKIGDEKEMEWAKFWINKGFIALEKVLKKSAGKHCYGDEVTMADLCLVPQVGNAVRFNVDMSSFPTINRIHDELSNLEAFKAAHPFVQPDCPEDLRQK